MGKVTAGYRYFVGLHLGICSGPVDALLEIRAGDRTAWDGQRYTITPAGDFGVDVYTATGTPAPCTANERLVVNAPELFGGDEKEGGLLGELDVMFGRDTQTPNSYLSAIHGADTPAYRGLFGVVWRRGQVSANNPYIKPWAFKVRRILEGWQGGVWYPSKAAIDLPNGSKAMNPAHIVYQCITDGDWGLGYGSSLIDDASFRAAADKFHAEGLGLCMKWTRQGTIESFVQLVMDHAGSILAQDYTTGLFKLFPLRADYTAETLPLFDESNIVALESYQRPAITDAVNEITVKFEDVVTGQDGSVTVQNLANITAQGGVVTQPKNYPGLPTAELAARVAMRDLKAVSTPLARVRFRCNRAGAALLPGQVVRLSWAKLGISQLVVRLVRVNAGTISDGTVDIEAVEDVFAMPSTAYVGQQPTGWTDPSSVPQAATNRVVREANAYEVRQELGVDEAAALPADAGFIVAAATATAGDAQDFGLRTKAASATAFDEVDRAPICPSGTITAALDPMATTATLSNMVDLDLVTRVGYAQLGAEIVRVNSLNRETGVVTFARGVCGTVATQHALGATLFFLDGFLALDPAERVSGEVVNVKLTPRTGRGQLAEALAPTDSITLAQAAARPYAPGRFRIAGQAYPTLVDTVPALSWAHRDRLQQNLEGDDVAGNIGPELGTTYTAEIRNGTTDALLVTQANIAGTSYTPSGLPSVPRLKVRLWAVRGGLASAQRHEWSFDYTAPTIAGGATFGVQASMNTGASSGGFIGSGNALRGVMSFGGVLVATDADSGSTRRIYTSADGGATWSLGYEGSAPVSYGNGVNSWDVTVGGNRLAYAINTTAGIREVLVATNNTTAPTVNTSKPSVGGATIDVGAVHSDGTTVYVVGRLASQLEAPGVFSLYSSTDGLSFTLVGAMSSDPADPNATPGANSGFDSRLFVPSGLFSGDEFSRLKKFGSRWFLVGRQAIYYTDEAVPRTLWRRCPLGLNDGATSPTITIEGLEQVGTKLVAWKSNVPVGGDVNPIAYSSDSGATWTTTRPAALGSLDVLSREGYVFGGRLHIVTHSNTGATRILHAADPAGTWTLQASTPFDNYAQALYPVITGSEVVLTSNIGGKRALVRSTDGVNFSAVSGIAGNPTAIAAGRLFTTSAAILNGSATGGSGGPSATRLLLHFDGANGSTTFTDSSLYSRAATVTGNAQISTEQSAFAGGASGLFDGTGDVVRIDHSSEIDPLAQDFTLECWVRFASLSIGQIIVTKSNTTGDYPFQLWYNFSSGRIQARSYDGASPIFDFGTSGPTVVVNTWYHVALCRSGSTVRLFIDGTQTGTANIGAAVLKSNTGPFCIGGYSDATFSLNGHIDELRLLIGQAAYTANFTRPTAPFANPANPTVALLLHFNGADASTTFTDSSGFNRPATVFGDARLTTTTPKFGTAAGLFDGAGDYLTFPDSADFNPGTSDFTVEAWIRIPSSPTTGNGYGIAGKGLSSTRGFLFYVQTNRNLQAPITSAGGVDYIVTTAANAISLDTWHHVALVREGRKVTIFVDGSVAAQDATLLPEGMVVRSNTTPLSIGTIYPGEASNFFFNGRIDEFRFTRGAVYTGTFTAPTAPFPDA